MIINKQQTNSSSDLWGKWREDEGKDKICMYLLTKNKNVCKTQNKQLAANMFPKVEIIFPNIPIRGVSGKAVIACLQVYFSDVATWLRLISGLFTAACHRTPPPGARCPITYKVLFLPPSW